MKLDSFRLLVYAIFLHTGDNKAMNYHLKNPGRNLQRIYSEQYPELSSYSEYRAKNMMYLKKFRFCL